MVGVIYRAGRILIDKRKPKGLLGGLWEFPGGKVQPGESLESALHRELREELDIEVEVVREIAVVEHTYTHFHVEIHAFECKHVQGEPRCITCAALKWVRPADLNRYAFPAANKKIIEILRGRDCLDLVGGTDVCDKTLSETLSFLRRQESRNHGT